MNVLNSEKRDLPKEMNTLMGHHLGIVINMASSFLTVGYIETDILPLQGKMTGIDYITGMISGHMSEKEDHHYLTVTVTAGHLFH